MLRGLFWKGYFFLSLSLLGLVGVMMPACSQAKPAKSIPFHLQQRDSGERPSAAELSRRVEAFIFEKTNQIHRERKLPILKSENLLAETARDHSQDMLKRNYLSHFSPEGQSVVDRYRKNAGKVQRSLGENLHTITGSQGLFDPEAIAKLMMDDWMHSPSHRENLLAKKYSALGVGCASDGQRIFCTQVFGGPEGR